MVNTRCVVVNCINRDIKLIKEIYSNNGSIKMYLFPKEIDRINLWRKLAGHKNDFSVKSAKICCLHFPEEDQHVFKCRLLRQLTPEIGNKPCRCLLRKGIDPSLNLPNGNSLSNERNRQKAEIKRRENQLLVQQLLDDSASMHTPGANIRDNADRRQFDLDFTAAAALSDEEDLQVFSESESEMEVKVKVQPPWCPDPELDPEPEVFSLQELCRVCGLPASDVMEIFGTEGSQQQLQAKINVCLPITVSSEDKLPLRVCRKCVTALDASHALATTCLHANIMLTNLWQQQHDFFNEEPETGDQISDLDPFHNIETCNNVDNTSSVPEPRTKGVLQQTHLCQFCLKEFGSQSELCSHMLEDHVFMCTVCGLSFRGVDKRVIETHHRTAHTSASIPRNYVTKYPCRKCNMEFQIESELKCHLTECSLIKLKPKEILPAKCDTQKKGTATMLGLNNESPTTEFDCKICFKLLKTTLELKKHYNNVHSVKLCDAKGCLEYFKSSNELKTHYNEIHKKNMEFICERCGKIFKTKPQLDDHIYYNHLKNENKFPCTLCDKKFRTKPKLNNHLKRHTGQKDVECTICGKFFYDVVRLRIHVEIHAKVKKYLCSHPGCGKRFSLKWNVESHKKQVHEKYWVFSCNVCNTAYANQTDVTTHYDTHTDQQKSLNKSGELFIRTSPYECEKCLKYYANKTSFDIHTRNCNLNSDSDKTETKIINKKIKALECHICYKRFCFKAVLKIHMGVHMDVKPFPCSHCSKTFCTNQALTSHTRIHTNETPFKCETCGKQFRARRYLLTHINFVHKQIRNFECTYCNKRFSRKNHLVMHIRTHTNERPYMCDICPQRFKQLGDMRRHIARHKK